MFKRLFIDFIFIAILSVVAFVYLQKENLILEEKNDESNLCTVATCPKIIRNTKPLLQNYPFPLLYPPVTIAEGFEAYDGHLEDEEGDPHWAIDYVKKLGEEFTPFPVYSANDGIAFQGFEKTFGKFVVVRKIEGDVTFSTLYSHLENIPEKIPMMKIDVNKSSGINISAGAFIGDAGTTGNTKGINQLHFELRILNPKTDSALRVDPYGIYSRKSDGLYPDPGQSLESFSHYWTSDLPPFAKE